MTARVMALTQPDPPGETTYWTAAAPAKPRPSASRRCSGSGVRTTYNRSASISSNSPLTPFSPLSCVTWSGSASSQIQALARRQTTLPMKPGKPMTRTNDYKHHGTTTLFAALDVLEGKLIGRLDTVEAAAPAGKVVQ